MLFVSIVNVLDFYSHCSSSILLRCLSKATLFDCGLSRVTSFMFKMCLVFDLFRDLGILERKQTRQSHYIQAGARLYKVTWPSARRNVYIIHIMSHTSRNVYKVYITSHSRRYNVMAFIRHSNADTK